jgi:hypothetical protein
MPHGGSASWSGRCGFVGRRKQDEGEPDAVDTGPMVLPIA